MKSKLALRSLCLGTALIALLGTPKSASACGGFFCSQSAPVNQAAERIIFSDNGNGTVTAVIQILYQGPAEKFSWVLPIAGVPKEGDIGVASNTAFQRLQTATNPQYNLTTRVEGQCQQELPGAASGGSTSIGVGVPNAGGPTAGGGVTVEASGVVGAFEWTVISLDQSLSDPSEAAVTWLHANGYDVPDGSRGLIRPYLQDGLNLLALKLTKGADAGSIRPVVLTYPADKPMIPIKLTAVAANEDMGVMTWLVSNARGVPQNYLSLELNEAKINWFNAGANYNQLVTAAANEASGQGFVTEFAGPSIDLSNVVWSSNDEFMWTNFKNASGRTSARLFDESFFAWGTFDGFWDVVRETVKLPADLSMEQLQGCPQCYADRLTLSEPAHLAALEKTVIEPMRAVQALLVSRPYVTRLYTTLSAAEMTVDPLFTFNPELPTVSNVHRATRVIECNANVTFMSAPWRIELPQGGVIRGIGSSNLNVPAEIADQPSNIRISRLASSGPGVVLEDNTAAISRDLTEYNGSVPKAVGSGGSNAQGGTTGAGGPSGPKNSASAVSAGGGCSIADESPTLLGWLCAAALGVAARRSARRNKRSKS
jgi:hypothetical protein